MVGSDQTKYQWRSRFSQGTLGKDSTRKFVLCFAAVPSSDEQVREGEICRLAHSNEAGCRFSRIVPLHVLQIHLLPLNVSNTPPLHYGRSVTIDNWARLDWISSFDLWSTDTLNDTSLKLKIKSPIKWSQSWLFMVHGLLQGLVRGMSFMITAFLLLVCFLAKP